MKSGNLLALYRLSADFTYEKYSVHRFISFTVSSVPCFLDVTLTGGKYLTFYHFQYTCQTNQLFPACPVRELLASMKLTANPLSVWNGTDENTAFKPL